ncbi:MAG: hypothetical protein ACFFAN_11325 [Promethearchaeota archaeon]
MVAPKAKTKKVIQTCDKCGGSMISIMIGDKYSKMFNFHKILQCKICRHWIKIE